jgi:peptide subunit release factor 1 (eRF1)
LKLLRAAADEVYSELEDYKPNAKSLVLMRDAKSGKNWRQEFQIPIAEIVEWAQSPYLLPLVEALDEHERFAVVLIERGRARIFVVCAGQAEEIRDSSEGDVSHVRSPGMDHRWSEGNFQRRVDGHVTHHVHNVIQDLSAAIDEWRVDRLILAGGLETRNELEHLLPKRLRRKVAGSVALPMSSTVAEVIRVVQETGAQAERSEESALVSQLVDAADGNNRAVTGLMPTIEALREAKIVRLVLSGGYRPDWGELPELEAWLRSDGPEGPADLTECLVEKTLQQAGRVEFVRGEAAERLEQAGGGIGAFLRY